MKNIKIDEKKYFQQKYINSYIDEKNNNWGSYRSIENFKVEEKKFKHLKTKKVYTPITLNSNLNLQESRGLNIDKETSIDSILKNIEKEMKSELSTPNKIRMNEILGLVKTNNIDIKNKNFLEIGFRIPKIQKFITSNLPMSGYGIDINNFNVELFKSLGYNVGCSDLNIKNNVFFNKKKFSIVSCYHVLEHTYNPEIAIKNIFENMSNQSILHIEIPIEKNNPNFSLGHLIGFEEGELLNLLKMTGFKVIYGGKSKIHKSGDCIERYIATKGY